MKAITICQPWAWAIIHGPKRVENRTWHTDYTGPLLIHAGASRAWLNLPDNRLPDGTIHPPASQLNMGAIIGRVNMVACLRYNHPSLLGNPFVCGPVCHIYEDPQPLKVPIPYRGRQGLFDVADTLLSSWEPLLFPVEGVTP